MTSEATVLIIDDSQANIYSMENLLSREGRKFLTASNGRDGLKIALANSIDLIILDVQMPDMDGFEVASVLKSNKRTRDIAIIFASAEKNERASIMKGFEGGAVDYLLKPLDPELTKVKVDVLLQIQLQKKELLEKNESLERADLQITKLNAELKKNVDQLEIINKELESFSYSISHDLRSPLRTLIGYSQMLEEEYGDKVGDEGKKWIQVLKRKASRMNQLIDDLLEFSRAGKQQLQFSNIEMRDLVQTLCNELNESSQHQATINIDDLDPGFGDAMLLRQVWINLISNAIKYSSKRENPAIEIKSNVVDSMVIYSVKDNGAGFDMEYVNKLFGVFQRLHKDADFAGTGIGLSIVQRIVLRHGGNVWAEGVVDQGATFFFSLPIRQSPLL
jgi:two-component system sensor histidine kinase/response regulator